MGRYGHFKGRYGKVMQSYARLSADTISYGQNMQNCGHNWPTYAKLRKSIARYIWPNLAELLARVGKSYREI